MSLFRLSPSNGGAALLGGDAPLPRLAVPLSGAVLITLLLFALMRWLIYSPASRAPRPPPPQVVEIVQQEPEQPKPTAGGSPPPPTALPPPPSLSSLSELAVPIADVPAIDASSPNMEFSPNLTGSKGFGAAFGGFAGSGSGTGTGSGFGAGQGFKGATLVPLSTQRPQIPESAYRRGIEGWVQVVFVVNTEGRVQDIKIVDAQPKGVFEAAAVAGVATWLYERSQVAREVTQKIEFKLEDYKYNWN